MPPTTSPPPPPQTRHSADGGSSPPSASSSQQLRILTLNVWGLKFISKLRSQRIQQIAAQLGSSSSPTYDVVCLQEIWYESVDWRHLQSYLSPRYPYSKFFLSGAFGSGLAILSRWPIVETRTHPYSLNGLPIHVQHGDWFVGKACGAATLEHPQLGLVDVWNTHFVAAGGEGGPESNRAHRITQAYELATNARNSAKRGRHTIVCGDLNSTPPALCLSLLREVGGLFDSWTDSKPGSDPTATSLPVEVNSHGSRLPVDPERALLELGITCDSPLNTWTAGKKLDTLAQKGAGKRLDYILYRGPEVANKPTEDEQAGVVAATTAYEASDATRGRLQCRSSEVVFTDPSSTLQVSLSDHFGVESVFQILPSTATVSNGSSEDGPVVVTTTTTRAKRIHTTLGSAMQALAGGHAKSRLTQRNHFYLFAASLVVALASIVGSIFQPLAGVNPLLVLLAVVAGWAGTTMLYSAVVWAEWEKRTLRTVMEMMEMEMNQTRRLVGPASGSGRTSTSAAGRTKVASVNGSAPVVVQEGTLF